MTEYTAQQRKALHVGFEQIAETLNAMGLDQRKVLKPSIDIPWTKEAVKEMIWRPVQKAMLNKKSTTKLEKIGEIDEVWDVVMRFLGENHDVDYIPFPHFEDGHVDDEGRVVIKN